MPEIPDMEEAVITIDGHRLRSALRRRLPLRIITFLLTLFVLTGAGYLLLPKSYTATVSLSMQQPTTMAGGLSAALPMLSTGSRKYIGVVKSRRIAAPVEAAVHTADLYHIERTDEAVDKLMKSVVVDDNPTDGLFYIQVTLPIPPVLFGGTAMKERVNETAVKAANKFAVLLRNYILNTDNDRDTTLLKAAKGSVENARSQYDRSVSDLSDFVRGKRFGVDNGASLAGKAALPTETSASGTAAQRLQSLYLQRGTVEADLRSLNAGQAAKLEKVEVLLKDPSALPAEDPLLLAARRAWLAARMERLNQEVQLADSAPAVVAARRKERKALDRLMQEARAVRRGLITEASTVASQRASLQERFNTIVGQIGQAEKDLQLNRELATEYENLRNKVTLRLEILKSTASQAAVLGLQTVSAQSRMQVVDWAQPARQARPTLLTIAVVGAFLSLLLTFLWVMRDYASTPPSGSAIVEREKVLT